jgi:hypothetical protein
MPNAYPWSLNDGEVIVKTARTDDKTDPITSQHEQTNNKLLSTHHKIFFKDL